MYCSLPISCATLISPSTQVFVRWASGETSGELSTSRPSLSAVYIWDAAASCLRWLKQLTRCPLALALPSAGKRSAARMAMIAMTTRISISVNAREAGRVAQVSNLLYRRASSLRDLEKIKALREIVDLPIGNRRYSRLETCATLSSRAVTDNQISQLFSIFVT